MSGADSSYHNPVASLRVEGITRLPLPMMMETYYGCVRTPADAIKLFEACRLGLLPRVQRRLSEKERQAIRSGSVFVWDEREAGMRRWTDGKSWSASRVSGSFLTYREMEGKRGNGFSGSRRIAGKTPDSGRGSDEDHDDGEPDGYRYKPDGLMKQSFSITTSTGQHLHLIAYLARGGSDLPQPSTDPALRNIIPVKGMYPESSLNDTPVPALTRAPMQPSHPPHHHPPPPPPPLHGYPVHYTLSYQWPPSPVGTPPYGHGHYPYSQGHHPPPLPAYTAHPHHHYQSVAPPPTYERAPLALPPPPPPQLPAPEPRRLSGGPTPQSYQKQSQSHSSQSRMSPPGRSILDSPRSQQLQAQAREAVQIDPRLALNHPRSQSGPLPPPNQPSTWQQNGGAAPPIRPPSPSPRSPSVSSPKSAVSEGPRTDRSAAPPPPTTTATTNKASLSALLLPPTPSVSSEPNSANPAGASNNSSSSSPRVSNGPPPVSAPPLNGGPVALPPSQDQRLSVEDARTIGALNRRFCG